MITDDPEIKVVAQLVGGVEPARTIMLKLLESGKDIVTANKLLLAEHGPELFDRARELGRSIAFEASVAGGIPIITNISQCFSANQIKSLRGILNGTTQFHRLADGGAGARPTPTPSNEAQRLGYAEADPTMDVDGGDAAQKLAILAHLAFGARVHWSEIPRHGIDTLDPADMRYAKELGYRIKLIAVAQLACPSGLELHVSPTLVKIGTPLAEVREAYNAIQRRRRRGRPGLLPRPGRRADADRLGRRRRHDRHGRRPHRRSRSARSSSGRSAKPASACSTTKQLPGRYYLRFTVEDRPGVLAEIAGVLGKHQISIASVIQHEPSGDGAGRVVPLVIMTHQAKEGAAAGRGGGDRSSCNVRMRAQPGAAVDEMSRCRSGRGTRP